MLLSYCSLYRAAVKIRPSIGLTAAIELNFKVLVLNLTELELIPKI
jgi:hypothetical protein